MIVDDKLAVLGSRLLFFEVVRTVTVVSNVENKDIESELTRVIRTGAIKPSFMT